MTTVTCDQCGKDAITPARITLTGLKSLAAKPAFARDFCGDECFRKWIRMELDARLDVAMEVDAPGPVRGT